ncbi:hypothetical protein HMPREF0373_02941 [Eubacterium ramulus ATCC 29099]|uniref:Uncharacterized protein n=1 Tax=Eubacterium ramulus ATCC 29099 TaxID=1256908 RepID=U2QM28_EUBRA|nr:hypothetical protein HMPREF0373_02941 [Eubacterium ramulus ATCC 29099]
MCICVSKSMKMSPFKGDIRLILYIVQNINFEKQRGYAVS